MMGAHINLRRNGFSFVGFVALGWWGILKAPWNRPLFSERYDSEKFRRLGFGWRWQIRRVRQINTQSKEG